jgi:uncharacterized protein with PhoU and TrkA domain
MVWLVENQEEMHPILSLALGESDEVIARIPVAPESELAGTTIAAEQLEMETGFYLLAIRRSGRYLYRPRGQILICADDELIASGPDEGQALLAERCGYLLSTDEDTGEIELVLSAS